MADVSFYDPAQLADIKRRRALADTLMKAGQQPTSTEMAGNQAIKQSPWAALARAAAQGVAGYQSGKADVAESDMQKAQRDRMMQAISTGKLNALAQGSPEEQQLALKQQLDIQGENRKFENDKTLEKMKLDALGARLSAGGGGGATGQLVQKLMDTTGMPFDQALYAVQTGMRQGQMFGANGSIVPMAGVPEAKEALKYAEQAGANKADIALKPLEKEAVGRQENINAIDKAKLEKTMANAGALDEQQATFNQIESLINQGAAGNSPTDRAQMLLHNTGIRQTPETQNTASIMKLGNNLVLSRGSLGAGVSSADAERYDKAAGDFSKAQSNGDRLQYINIMREIGQKADARANATLDAYKAGNTPRFGNNQQPDLSAKTFGNPNPSNNPPALPSGGLTPTEQSELEALRAKHKR